MDDSLTANDTPTSNDCETLIQAAVSAVRAGNLSFRAAGKQFGIPPTTISNRFHGRQALSVAHEHQQLLSNAHKEVVIKWARWHGDMADPLSRVKLRALIHNLTHQIAIGLAMSPGTCAGTCGFICGKTHANGSPTYESPGA